MHESQFQNFHFLCPGFWVMAFIEHFNSSKCLIWKPNSQVSCSRKAIKTLFLYPNLFPIGFDTLLKGLKWFNLLPVHPWVTYCRLGRETCYESMVTDPSSYFLCYSILFTCLSSKHVILWLGTSAMHAECINWYVTP